VLSKPPSLKQIQLKRDDGVSKKGPIKVSKEMLKNLQDRNIDPLNKADLSKPAPGAVKRIKGLRANSLNLKRPAE